jgi:hypothetical protein
MPAAVIVPIIAAVVSAAAGAYQQSEASRQGEIQQNEAMEEQRAAEQRAVAEQKAAEERQRKYNEEVAAANQKAYRENAYPTEAEIEAERAAGLKTLGNDRVSRLNQLARASATRGFGSGSGAISQGGSAIESAYLEGLSGLSSNLSKLANTPKAGFTFPFMSGVNAGGANASIGSARSGYSILNGTGSSDSPLGTAMGYMMGSGGGLGSLFSNNNTNNPSTSTYPQEYSLYGY